MNATHEIGKKVCICTSLLEFWLEEIQARVFLVRRKSTPECLCGVDAAAGVRASKCQRIRRFEP